LRQPASVPRVPAHFELADESAMRVIQIQSRHDLGLMLYDVFDLDVSRDQKPGKVKLNAGQVFRRRTQDGVLVQQARPRSRLAHGQSATQRCPMMLQALIHYAERENLGDPDFEPAHVDWLDPVY